ncbi:hypothetical protein KKG72_09635 [bacterium]|nr:hypothetical protein [bacterium]MBU1993839.1 hypothetical protein [bacterium]
MLEIFVKNKKMILRGLGAFMLLVGFVIHFKIAPKEGVSDVDLAAANVARMEASVAGSSSSSKSAEPSQSPFLEEFKNTQAKQMQYLTIIAMILGAGFLGYSFFKKDA